MSSPLSRCLVGSVAVILVLLAASALRAGEPDPEASPPAEVRESVPVHADVVKELPRDPVAALELVRDRVRFRPYPGFVKGWRGAWWDGTANSADAAELLVQTLRRMRLPAVLVKRRLSEEEARNLLLRAAGNAEIDSDIQKSLEGTEVSKGWLDTAVVASVRDHWFVRTVADGKWIALDPFFDDAGGPLPARPKAEVVRVQDRRRLRIEVFTRLEGKPRDARVFFFERAVSDLIGARLTLILQGIDNEARDRSPAPGVFRPVLFVHGEPKVGRTFSGIPATGERAGGGLGRVFGQPGAAKAAPKVEEVRVDYVLHGAGLPDRKESRYLYLAGEGGLDRLADITGLAVVCGAPTRTVLNARCEAAEGVAAEVADVELPKKGPATEEQEAAARKLFDATFCFLDSAALSLASATHELVPRLDAAFGTISSAGDARVLGVTLDPRTGGLRTDLVFDTVTTWARPGVKESAVAAHAGLRGRLDADVEGALLGALRPEEKILTVSSVFTAAREQEVPLIVLSAENREVLEEMKVSPRAKRILGERIDAGRDAMLPERPVEVGGESVLAWYEYDPATRAWTGVFEDGRHQAATETAEETAKRVMMTTFCQGYYAAFNSTLVGYAKEVLLELRSDDFNWTQVHLTALGNACKLSDDAIKKAFKDLDGVTKTMANYGAIFGQASAVVLLAVCMPVK